MKTSIQRRIDAQFEQGPVPQSAPFSAYAFDGLCPTNPNAKVADRKPAKAVRAMSVQHALEWAFGVELASLDFDEWARPGVGVEYVLMQRAMLGETIDCSGGASRPADDAEMIGDAVRSVLDWRDAVWVAELARSGRVPDCLAEVRQKYEPNAWSFGRGGKVGAKINGNDPVAMREHSLDPDLLWRRRRRSRKTGAMTLQPCELTPVRLEPSPVKIGQMRRAYQKWWSHLFAIRERLKAFDLVWVSITEAMPDRAPWLKVGHNVLTE